MADPKAKMYFVSPDNYRFTLKGFYFRDEPTEFIIL